jgi:hypothetical protein
MPAKTPISGNCHGQKQHRGDKFLPSQAWPAPTIFLPTIWGLHNKQII